jgi:membrane fusion protein, multidrug efflux system
MKRILPIFALFSVLAACEMADNSELGQLVSKRELAKKSYDSLGVIMAELDAQIMALDTTTKATLITTYTVKTGPFDSYFFVQGNVESEQNAQIFPEVNGLVKRIAVREGDRVSSGQLLLELDVEVIRKNIAEVETSYALANELFNKQKKLWDQNIGSEVQFLEAKNRKDQLEGTLATLRKQMDMGMVRAPFSGIVDEIVPKLGEMASPMMPVARVLNLGNVYVDSDVSEYHFGKVSSGDKVTIIVPDVDTIATTISRVGNYIKPENRTFNMRVDISDGSKLIPNLVATLKVNDFHADSTIVLPSSMILENISGEKYVYVVNGSDDDAQVEKRLVQTGRSYNGQVVILEGLKPGERIVEKGARKVVDGRKVRIKEA